MRAIIKSNDKHGRLICVASYFCVPLMYKTLKSMDRFAIFSVAASILCLASCGEGGHDYGYSIKGHADCLKDGDAVYISFMADDGDGYVNDTAVVSSGRFVFEGKKKTPEIAYVSYRGMTGISGFIVEPGNIRIDISEGKVTGVKGTENNAIYREYESSRPVREYYDYVAGVRRGIIKDIDTARLMGLYDSFMDESMDFMKENAENPAGTALLKYLFYNLSVAQVDTILDLVPDETKISDVLIKRIKYMNDTKKKTDVGARFVDFKLKDLEGNAVRLSDYAGKGSPVLIDFWASWCVYCIKEMPDIKKLYDKYKDRNFEIVGVSLDNDHGAWENSVRKHEMDWPQMSDLEGWACEAAKLYGIESIPHTVLIDADGKIAVRGMSVAELDRILSEMLD